MKPKKPKIFPFIIGFGLILIGINLFASLMNRPETLNIDELVNKIQQGEVANVNITPKNGVYEISGMLVSQEEGNYLRMQQAEEQKQNQEQQNLENELQTLKSSCPINMNQEQIDARIKEIETTLAPKSSFPGMEAAILGTSSKVISGEKFVVNAIGQEYQIKTITDLLDQQKITYNIIAYKAPINWLGLIMQLGMFAFLGFFIFNMIKGGAPGVNNKEYTPKVPNIHFSDVIGYDEEKQELSELVDFLKNPQKYHKMGAKLPRGVLLEGPPGTGKTLMAKAVAGESNVPFFAASGSDFEEMYVGLGASRIRKLFKDARKSGPAIIFIDEIDAIGKRNVSANSNPAQNQTINSLLVEMDGFDTSDANIIVMAATNKKDNLDEALLRPGRFDRQILVDLPPVKTRESILKFHLKNKKISSHIDFGSLARSTTGMSGAQLAAVANEGALLAVRENKEIINQEMLQEAIDRVLMGPAKITNKYSAHDKKVVSYHESGHCIVGLELEGAMEVQKITIIPRRDAGGYVSYIPSEEEERFTTKRQLLDRLTSLVAGRVSEEIFIGDITVGAFNDFEQATKIARAMVTKYGMSELGVCQFELGVDMDPYAQKQYSDNTANNIDRQIDILLTNAINQAREILTKRADDVHLLAATIREREVLDKEQIDYLLQHRELPQDSDEVYTASEPVVQQEEVQPTMNNNQNNHRWPRGNNGTDAQDFM